jgi:NitT/TauT family transport system substrate-binding protein
MKISFRTLTAVLLIAVVLGPVWAGGQKESGAASTKPLAKVNIALHANATGATLISVAEEKGFFKEYGIDAQITIVESGVSEMAAMRAENPTLDAGYIGAGVAWNPIDSTGNSLSFIFFDDLSNAERLIARKGIFRDSNNDGNYDYAEMYAGLRGKTIYIEVGTTPGGWFKNLLDAINQNYADGDKLWIHCEDSAYMAGYKAPNNKPENRILVVNYQNSNIPAGMATAASNASVDIAAAFEPIPSTILKTVKDIEQIADFGVLPKEKVLPSTIVANTKWLKANPDLAKNFVYALYKAAVWRAKNESEALRIAERVCVKPEGTFLEGVTFFPTGADYRDWFATPDSIGFKYMRALYNERVPNLPQGTIPKPFEQAVDFSYMLKAIETVE